MSTIKNPVPGIQGVVSLDDVLTSIDAIDPKRYDRTRNYLDGAVTWLSPYITHGVIDTVDVATRTLSRHSRQSCYKLLFELAWREYFHRIWQDEGNAIFDDIFRPQMGVERDGVPEAICLGNTGIAVIDEGIQRLNETGLMHNHLRLWVAGLTCNLGHTSWKDPARWLHYHLLDGDLASNTLSWQWVAGTSSHKQYIANQANINKYSKTNQSGTWLDLPYDRLALMAAPPVLKKTMPKLRLSQTVPGTRVPHTAAGTIALHSLWNLDPSWRTNNTRHVLFIDQKQVDAWPMSENRWAFIKHWANEFDAEIWLDHVSALHRLADNGTDFVRKEYPACVDWPGTVTERRFIYDYPKKQFQSFSQFWKQVKEQDFS